jgi:hypothetical protein
MWKLYHPTINNTKTNKYNIHICTYFVVGGKTALLAISCQPVLYMNKSGVYGENNVTESLWQTVSQKSVLSTPHIFRHWLHR